MNRCTNGPGRRPGSVRSTNQTKGEPVKRRKQVIVAVLGAAVIALATAGVGAGSAGAQTSVRGVTDTEITVAAPVVSRRMSPTRSTSVSRRSGRSSHPGPKPSTTSIGTSGPITRSMAA